MISNEPTIAKMYPPVIKISEHIVIDLLLSMVKWICLTFIIIANRLMWYPKNDTA